MPGIVAKTHQIDLWLFKNYLRYVFRKVFIYILLLLKTLAHFDVLKHFDVICEIKHTFKSIPRINCIFFLNVMLLSLQDTTCKKYCLAWCESFYDIASDKI